MACTYLMNTVFLHTGYVQGMNDILSPLLFVLGSEHQAFWCFTDVMRRMVGLLHGNLVHWLFMYSSHAYKLFYKCMYARHIHYAYIKGLLPIKLLHPLLPSHHLSSIQHSTFSDLTLSQPLDTVARLCCYASPQLHDHISTLWQSHSHAEARDCVGDVMIVAMYLFFTQAVSMMGKTGFSASGISLSIHYIPVTNCSNNEKLA